ncbi:UTRA domain-containing protein [Nocardiopsis algeriensis]|uniref:GntR family transcriptional regulator n=1 Tax=Nocardiopsis algeriensis TaxID=1478215 RepID=A0A841ILK5_9ACTN|nr:GntR family transcriptional regulator [Nocardiopsis algeriensis]
MPTSENGSTPVYREIADELREQIRSGRLTDGDRLPGENTLMERHGIARATARQALSELINEGLASPVRGSGVYVRLFRPVRRHGSRRLSRDIWGRGGSIWQTQERDYEVDRLLVDEAVPEAHVARALGLAEEEAVLRRSRRYLVDGRPVQNAVSYLAPAVAAAAPRVREHDTGPGGVYARLAEVGLAPVRFTEEIRVRMPTPGEREDLSLPPGTPVVDVARTALADGNRPVEFGEITMDGSAYVLQYDFEA